MITKLWIRWRALMGIAIGLVATTSASAWAGSFTPGDILVSSTTDLQTSLLREYTPTGTLVQTFSVPIAPGGDSYSRGVATDASGNAQIYNGTFSPYLTTLNPTGSGSFSNHTFSGWSTVNDIYFGGVAVNGNYAYATDMATFGGGSPQRNRAVRPDQLFGDKVRLGAGERIGRLHDGRPGTQRHALRPVAGRQPRGRQHRRDQPGVDDQDDDHPAIPVPGFGRHG